ncbi:MAG: hypothetical protein AAF741_16595 [Bacteroidota bacterium]
MLIKYLLIPLFGVLATTLFAQSPLWSAEVEIEMTTVPTKGGEDRCTQLLRRPDTEAIGKADEFFDLPMGLMIIQSILDGNLETYYDKELSKPIPAAKSYEWLSVIDTVVTYDPATYEEIVEVVFSSPSVDNVKKVGLIIQLSYGSKKLISQKIICGYFHYESKPSEYEHGSTFNIYFPVKSTNRSLNFHKRKWNVIDRHMRNINIERFSVSPTSNLTTSQMFESILKTAKSGTDNNFVLTDGSFEPLGKLDREMIKGGTIDTIITYDPVTHKEHIEVIATSYENSLIDKLRLVQYWAWDAKRAELTILPLGHSPILRVEDEVGKFLYDLPLFYYIPRRFRE